MAGCARSSPNCWLSPPTRTPRGKWATTCGAWPAKACSAASRVDSVTPSRRSGAARCAVPHESAHAGAPPGVSSPGPSPRRPRAATAADALYRAGRGHRFPHRGGPTCILKSLTCLCRLSSYKTASDALLSRREMPPGADADLALDVRRQIGDDRDRRRRPLDSGRPFRRRRLCRCRFLFDRCASS